MPMPVKPTVFLDERAGAQVQEFLWDALNHRPFENSTFAVISDTRNVLLQSAMPKIVEGLARQHQGQRIKYGPANELPRIMVPKLHGALEENEVAPEGVLKIIAVSDARADQKLRGVELVGAWIYGNYGWHLESFLRTYEVVRVSLQR